MQILKNEIFRLLRIIQRGIIRDWKIEFLVEQWENLSIHTPRHQITGLSRFPWKLQTIIPKFVSIPFFKNLGPEPAGDKFSDTAILASSVKLALFIREALHC